MRVGDVTAFTEGNGSVDSAAEFNALIALPGPHGVTEFTAGLEYRITYKIFRTFRIDGFFIQ